LSDQGPSEPIRVMLPMAHNFFCTKDRVMNVKNQGFGSKCAYAYWQVSKAWTITHYKQALDWMEELSTGEKKRQKELRSNKSYNLKVKI
jgi:hypothetical protein